MNVPVTVHNFAQSTDEAIIEEARKILRTRDPKSLRPVHRKILSSRRPDVMAAGKFLWAYLTSK